MNFQGDEMVRDNQFIVIEGPHGSGKTTQAKLLENYLLKEKKKVKYLCLPYLKELRNVIDKYLVIDNKISAHILFFIHLADRYAQVDFIKKKLIKGINIISDRYVHSCYVYQQIQGIPLELIEQCNYFCIKPDYTFVLDVPIDERKKRLKNIDRFRKTIYFKEENFALEDILYNDVYNHFSDEQDKIFKIDGTQTIMDTHDEIISILRY